MQILWILARNLLATIAIEGAAILILHRELRFLRYSVYCNVLTNPVLGILVILGVRALGVAAYWPLLAVLEVAVVLVEAHVYRALGNIGGRRALLHSAACNAASFLAGLLLF